MGTKRAESVSKSGDKLQLSTFAAGGPVESLGLKALRASVEQELGAHLWAYEVAAELNIHPTLYSHLESGRKVVLANGIGRQQAIRALKTVAERKQRELAAEGDAA